MSAQHRELQPVQPFDDFRAAASEVLRLLHQRVGMGLWLVTRTEGEDWIVLTAEDHGYGVVDGDVFRWSDSFCSRMVRGEGPRIAPNSSEVPAYAKAPIGQQVPIGSYIGVPLVRSDGRLFGTLCAIDPESKPESLTACLDEVEVHSRLLATILNGELERQDHARRLERAEAESETDALTGAYNRRGWERLRAAEEGRCNRYGNPAGVMVLDLNGLKQVNDEHGHAAGDRMLRGTCDALRKVVRQSDVLARLGGDEFGVLAVEATRLELAQLVERMKEALRLARIRASIGWASRDPRRNLLAAQELADQRMYQRKRLDRKRAARYLEHGYSAEGEA